MKRTHLGTAIGATAASVAVGMALAGPASAASPDPAPFCGAGGFTLANNTAGGIPDNSATGVSRSITVTGQTGTIRDVDVLTNIIHPVNGEVDIELIPPTGPPIKFVTSVIPNRAGANGFAGTLWDDDALGVVAEQNWQISGPKLALVPEGALASLIGRDPNGTWTLRVRDLGAGDMGTLNGWSLDVKTSTQGSAQATASFAGPGGTLAPNAGDPHAAGASLTRQVQVSGAQPYLADLNLNTAITHALDPEELEIKLTSPAGTTAFISRRRGSGSLSSMTTRWDDSAGVLVATKGLFAPNTTEPTMVPEGAMGAFIGENPNGVWTLTITDVVADDGFSLNGWSLDVTSQASCPPPPGGGAPGTTPGTVGLPRGPVCRKVNLVTTILGAKRGERGDVARIKVKVANKTRNARARAAKAVFKLPAGFTLAGKQKGITLKKGKVTATFGVIAGGKAKTKTIKLKAKANAAFGRKVSSVAVTALCGSKAKGATIKLIVARG
jgi:subtilisin-like proprotein convertase family protein